MPLLTAFDPWQSNLCTCPPKFSLSPYTGCSHRCLYCYASSYIRNFSLARGKKDFIDRLKKVLKKIPPNSFLTIANSSDPYQPLEKKLHLTHACMEILKDFDLRIMIVTKSALISQDLELLKKIKKLVICITLTTLKENLAEKLEAGADLPSQKLKAITQIAKFVPVICRFDPLIYPLNTGEIKNIVKKVKTAGAAQIITSTYKAKPDNFNRMIKNFPEHKDTWTDLYLKKGEKRGNYIYLPKDLRRNLIEKVRQCCIDERLDFSTCREGFSSLNTKICDGSSFFPQP
ncbi:MAG: radical SAM protein [Candidatus Omnitrophota bacterium]